MIDITIKTLDSMNHQFSVQDDLTVKNFKEQIATQVNVPAESQRLIYCGRVLVDEKKLAEYDVHGKVIHLVQRAPPSTTASDSGNSGGEGRSTQSRNVTWRPFNQTVRLDGANGNAMYLGAMAFPAEMMDAQGITVPQAIPGLSQNRFSVWRVMLRRARSLMRALENPNQSQPEPPPQPAPNANDMNPFYPMVAQALSDAVTRVTGNNVPPPVINIEFAARRLDGSNDELGPDTSSSNSPDDGMLSNASIMTDPLLLPPESERPSEQPSAENAGGESSSSRNGSRPRSANSTSSANTAELALLVAQLRDLTTRMLPFLQHYHDLMRDDPAMESHPTNTQRMFNRTSELMHYMAHVYHAISDVICDFSQPPPRTLRCRPVLIQHSAVLQAGIPIQLNMGPSRGASAGSGEPDRNSNASATPGSNTAANASTQEERPPASSSNPSTSEDPPRTSTPTNRDPESAQAQTIMQLLLDNLVSPNIWTQMGEPGGAASRMPEESAANSAGDGNEAAPSEAEAHSDNPDAPCVCPIHSNSERDEFGFPTNSSASRGPPVPSSQAWAASGTWPTTSTNTRSTTRPHVHISPSLQGLAGVQGFFDPFLPCNSHHIRTMRRRHQAQQADQATASNTSAGETAEAASATSSSATFSGRSETPLNSDGTRVRSSRGVVGMLNRMIDENEPLNLARSMRMINERMLSLRGNDNTIVFHIPNRRQNTLSPFLRMISDSMDIRDLPNLLSELVTTIMTNLRLFDFWSADTRQILISLRSGLNNYVRETLLRGQSGPEAIRAGVDRLNAHLRLAFRSFQDYLASSTREESNINVVETLNQINSHYFPLLINDILQQVEALYLHNFVKHFTEYFQQVIAFINHLCQPPNFNSLEAGFIALGSMVLVSTPRLDLSVRQYITRELRRFAGTISTQIDPDPRFIVRNSGSGSTSTSTPPQTGAGANVTPPFIEILIPGSSRQSATPQPVPPPPQATPRPDPIPPVATPQQPPPPAQPMEVEDPFVETEGVPTAEQIAEPLPDVIIGAEQWHNHVPADWVPIITRDRDRQRRQSTQGALSETYLSGMPSKRRKVVSSAKPNSNLSRVISESMTTAMGAAGVSPIESVAESAGTDANIRSAYKEQVRTTVEARLRTHPDYKPEKYPNAAKLFGPK